MIITNGRQPYPTQVLDYLFSHYDTQLPATRPPVGTSGTAGPLAEPESPPAIRDAADLKAANEWFQRERARLQQYTEGQLARVQTEHQALVGQKYVNEQTVILRGQELSRKEELLARQSRALQKQALELSQREQALAGQLEKWIQARSELADLSQVRVRTEQQTEQQRALLETLRVETLALQKSREDTQAELEAMARALEEQREERAKERALARAHQAQMERRLRELDQTELAAQRRVAELDELEVRMREEFEEQERQLAEQRRDVAALYARLRQPPKPNGERPA